MINLKEIHRLAVAVRDVECGSAAWDKATDALNSKFSPECLVNLIDQLQAADALINQYSAENTKMGNDIMRKIVAETAMRQRILQLESLERANAAQDNHINQQQARIDRLEAANSRLGKALSAAQAEIERRDAAAGEPTGVVTGHAVNGCVVSGNKLSIGDHVYTAAQPAVLPQGSVAKALNDCDWSGVSVGNKAIIRAAIDALALGAQPALVSSVPETFSSIGARLRTQDNRCTSHPIFCVFEKRATPAAERYNDSRIEWYNPERERDATKNQYRRLEALYQGGRCNDNDYGDWRRLAMCDIDVFVTACFTEAGCKEYLRINGHNLRRPFTYVTSAHGNAEWRSIRDWLMNQGSAQSAGVKWEAK